MGKGTRATAGHMPLTHHERTKKFTIHSSEDSADYGTTSLRLAGHSQYQIGTCALTTQSLQPSGSSNGNTTTSIAMCSPSGYMYDESSILEYLLLQTQQIKQKRQQKEEMEHQEVQQQLLIASSTAKKRQMESFDESQRIIKKNSSQKSDQERAIDDLHRVSYWLSSAQPVAKPTALNTTTPNNNGNLPQIENHKVLALTNGDKTNAITNAESIPTDVVLVTTKSETISPEPTIPVLERPSSPMTGQPLARRDLWPIQLEWTSDYKVKCSISDRTISTTGAAVVAYWTTSKPYRISSSANDNDRNTNRYGVVVLQSVYEDELKLKVGVSRCPITDRMIHHVRILQRSGSSYAASGQNVVSAKQYKPTIT